MDFEKHNQEIRELWSDFKKGRAKRPPVMFHMNNRMWLLNRELNRNGWTFERYFSDPEIIFETELNYQLWRRTQVMEDIPKGLPDAWSMTLCGQNVTASEWLGAEIMFRDDDVPSVLPLLAADKGLLAKLNTSDPLKSRFADVFFEYYEYFNKKQKEGFEFHGRPLKENCRFAMGFENPFTSAVEIRGGTELMLDIYEDPAFVHELLSFLVEAKKKYITEWNKWSGNPVKQKSFGVGDDSIESISVDTYNEFVYPYHRELVEYFSSVDSSNSAHLCGAAQHHFKNLRDKFNVRAFDTGFPTDLAKAREELGPDVVLWGNVHVGILERGNRKEIEEAVDRIFNSGAVEGRTLILADGNNVTQQTSADSLNHMYEYVRNNCIYGDTVPCCDTEVSGYCPAL